MVLTSRKTHQRLCICIPLKVHRIYRPLHGGSDPVPSAYRHGVMGDFVWNDATVVGVSFAVSAGAGISVIALLQWLRCGVRAHPDKQQALVRSAASKDATDDATCPSDGPPEADRAAPRLSLPQLASKAAEMGAFLHEHFRRQGNDMDGLESASVGASSISSHDSLMETGRHAQSYLTNAGIELDFDDDGFIDDPLLMHSRTAQMTRCGGYGTAAPPIVLTPLYTSGSDDFLPRWSDDDERSAWRDSRAQPLFPPAAATTADFYQAHGILSKGHSMLVGAVPVTPSASSSESSDDGSLPPTETFARTADWRV